MVSMRRDPRRYVLKGGCVGNRWDHGSSRPVSNMSLSKPDLGFSAVSLKLPPKIISWFNDWKALTCLVRS